MQERNSRKQSLPKEYSRTKRIAMLRADIEENILETLMESGFDLDKDVDINITGTKIILENLRIE